MGFMVEGIPLFTTVAILSHSFVFHDQYLLLIKSPG
jgi:hypothetical protein